jgi:transcriptional regulator with XRE-family HTH domain
MNDRTTRGSFAAGAFIAALDSERSARGLAWKQVAEQAKVSQSTLTRLTQGKRPDVDSLAALVDWAGLSADDFMVRVLNKREAEPIAMISTRLRADPHLSPVAAEAVEKIIRVVYQALREV